MRFNIVSEIMQATTANNLKKARGISEDKQYEAPSTAKGDLLQSRNLSKYIKQLTYAKARCEKQLKLVGGLDCYSPSEEQESLPGRKVFAFSVLMESPVCREYLARFLQGEEVGKSLLSFWQDIENMKLSSKDEWHQLGNEIYQTYIKRPRPGIRLSKGVLKGIEAFIMANKLAIDMEKPEEPDYTALRVLDADVTVPPRSSVLVHVSTSHGLANGEAQLGRDVTMEIKLDLIHGINQECWRGVYKHDPMGARFKYFADGCCNFANYSVRGFEGVTSFETSLSIADKAMAPKHSCRKPFDAWCSPIGKQGFIFTG
ncbi:sorting nexin-25-like [Dermacentor silvarum]|uniref:sorting nexin-25-like n=1 Tax=Dermacentor silvarum TaxID=543639 RepID=UPI0021010AB1|nr:sorting nexin-25-like [Dermacentor silvarum]